MVEDNDIVISGIFKLTDRGASRSYFKNFCPRLRPRPCHLVYPNNNS